MALTVLSAWAKGLWLPYLLLQVMVQGRVVEVGSRHGVPHEKVVWQQEDNRYLALTDENGYFRLELASDGLWQVSIASTTYEPFSYLEYVDANQSLAVLYRLEPKFQLTYQTLVRGAKKQSDGIHHTLTETELAGVPGAMNDPFKAIASQPGVGQMASFLSFPIVRGSSPSSTGILLDGISIPLLFHFLVGSSVVHPSFLEKVDFYPGPYPARYGGYVSGIIDGISRQTLSDEFRLELDIALLQTGIFWRQPIKKGLTFAVAFRYGYPGWLLSALNTNLGLDYWDYQARLDMKQGRHLLKVFFIGAKDRLDSFMNNQDTLIYGAMFHRLDLGYKLLLGDFEQSYNLIFGINQTITVNAYTDVRSWMYQLRGRWQLKLWDGYKLRLGSDFSEDLYIKENLVPSLFVGANFYKTSAFVELPMEVTSFIELLPGLRYESYATKNIFEWRISPRFQSRFKIMAKPEQDLWLEASVGRYYQPPRLAITMPGVEQLALAKGLLASWQTELGLLWNFPRWGEIHMQSYFNWVDPMILDLSINFDPAMNNQAAALNNGGGLDALFSDLTSPSSQARMYGLEIRIKKAENGPLYGWLSYTLSRSERLMHGQWYLFDFDRTHSLNLLIGSRFPRGWRLALQNRLFTGRPMSTATAYNSKRAPIYYRFDVRIDKQAVYRTWMIDFYLDIMNATLSAEYFVDPTKPFVYLLPSFGLKGVF